MLRADVGVKVSTALLEAFPETEARRALMLAGGDDYELCFTAPAKKRDRVREALDAVATPATRVGTLTAGASLRLFDADGLPVAVPPRRGYVHFTGEA